MERTSFYPYPPRPGANYEALNLDISTNFEILDEETLQEVILFENQLYYLALNPDEFSEAEAYRAEKEAAGTPIEPIESVWKRRINITALGVDYFLTDEGRVALAEATGASIGTESVEECSRILSSIDIGEIDSKVLDKLEADSIGYAEDALTQSFIDSGFSGEGLDYPSVVSVYKNPENIVAKARGYRQLKTYINRVMSDLATSETDASSEAVQAKLLIADLYRKRLNGLIASNYVDAYKFLHQTQLSGVESQRKIVSELEGLLPAFFDRTNHARTANFLQRMDRYRHGVSVDASGKFTWLSPEAKSLAEKVGQIDTETTDIDRELYGDTNPEVLESTEISGDTFGSWISDILEEYGLLSEHVEWDSEREEPAPDGKWQVIVNDKFKSLSVNDSQRIVKVPAKNVTVEKAVSVGNHELTHVLQNENKRAIGNLAIMQKVRIDISSEQSEAGGKWQERVAREKVKGKTDDEISGTGYLKALEVKASGGNYGDVVQIYYEDLLARNPSMKPEKAAAQAVNRARRVYRSGGHQFTLDSSTLTNTQPLNYLEQRLIYENLTDDQRRLLFVGGITIANLAKLSQKGLVDVDNMFIPEKMPWELMYPKVKEIVS